MLKDVAPKAGVAVPRGFAPKGDAVFVPKPVVKPVPRAGLFPNRPLKCYIEKKTKYGNLK